MSAWDASAWIGRWEAAGGGWSVVNGRLAFLLPDDAHDRVAPMMADLTSRPERLTAVRVYLAGGP